MIDKNIILIHHLTDNCGNILLYDEFCDKYGNLISHFDYMSIIDAIPCKWKRILKIQNLPAILCNVNENPILHLQNTDKDLSMINSSDIYWKIISTFKDVPTCINSWSSRLNLETDIRDWTQRFTLYNKCTKDIKVREIQLKIIHRFYPCQSLIAKWDKHKQKNVCTVLI